VTVKPAKLLPAGSAKVLVVKQVPGTNVGRNCRNKPHSTPARAAWKARVPCTSNAALTWLPLDTLTIATPKPANTTSKNIAVTMLTPYWFDSRRFMGYFMAHYPHALAAVS
jgi:hypothetical protein